ncbi:MAG: hypothetical protein J6D29_08255 [Solobacterium sp.]|nr:hypothetical protein [Solobacterium sp.]
MKKTILILFLLSCLCGCTKVTSTMQAQLESKLNAMSLLDADAPIYNHRYYLYYKEPMIGKISSDITSNIFTYEGTRFVMNLNVPAIINNRYYPDGSAEIEGLKGLEPAAKHNGVLKDHLGEEHPYEVKIYELGKQEITVFSTDLVDFYAVNAEKNGPHLAGAMYRIARSLTVDKELILADFSNRKTISNVRKKLELFQNIAPESGVIDELFINHDAISEDQVNIYNVFEEDEVYGPDD